MMAVRTAKRLCGINIQMVIYLFQSIFIYNMKKNQFNKEGNPEGYHEDYYWSPGKGYFINGIRIGYWEFYHNNGEILYKEYYLVD